MKIKETTILIYSVLFLISCGEIQQKEGQKQPLLSPSGKFIAEMQISRSNPNLHYPVWTPIIKDKNGKLIYKDNSSNLSGYHNSYWDWGEYDDDRFWVYNSDTGEVTYYDLYDGGCKKTIFDTKYGSLMPPKIIRSKINKYKNKDITSPSSRP